MRQADIDVTDHPSIALLITAGWTAESGLDGELTTAPAEIAGAVDENKLQDQIERTVKTEQIAALQKIGMARLARMSNMLEHPDEAATKSKQVGFVL